MQLTEELDFSKDLLLLDRPSKDQLDGLKQFSCEEVCKQSYSFRYEGTVREAVNNN